MKKTAFTLAEVLITLGIIGVVAALTIPSLIANYQKQEAVTKLKKFYNTMNQAVKLSEIENGDASDWNLTSGHASYQTVLDFYNTYLAKYIIKTKEIKPCDSSPDYDMCVYMADGTIFKMGLWSGVDTVFYTNEKCLNTPTKRCFFQFGFRKTTGASQNIFEPYAAGAWDGTREGLKNNYPYGCLNNGAYCAKLIQWDDWEIKDDYPW